MARLPPHGTVKGAQGRGQAGCVLGLRGLHLSAQGVSGDGKEDGMTSCRVPARSRAWMCGPGRRGGSEPRSGEPRGVEAGGFSTPAELKGAGTGTVTGAPPRWRRSKPPPFLFLFNHLSQLSVQFSDVKHIHSVMQPSLHPSPELFAHPRQKLCTR